MNAFIIGWILLQILVTDKLFKEGEDIMIELDIEVFKLQKIITNHR